MEVKYIQGIKAGIAGGIVLALSQVLQFVTGLVADWTDLWVLVTAAGCLVFLLWITVSAGTGALSVRMAAPYMMKLTDAVLISAVGGGVAGIVNAAMQVLIAIMTPIFSLNTSDLVGGFATGVTQGGLTLCCAPIGIILCIVLAIIGGVIYGIAVLKLQ
ncbi:hypothetical protein CUJ83_14675 [Methanocella sp. CWC-04]|uniref:Uncharacterized protein n=1 Tax=Methanooceanicella nereidis TaxID=2052831 RepID=A0AAP2RF56_9EURY|nr:hypothetical protein [Methanocella sp. CWC-04]MCD1296244.1 hypothetical protein [Methanocella sp. CWC-04]